MTKVYLVSKTLMGGPDVNRRTIYETDLDPNGQPDFRTERAVCIINQDMQQWTVDHERWLETILSGLRSAQS